jgi:hypothetical protein|tara:strand:- start:5872 stop:6162 length:291 start_codon:yes stop_codon:yes gene_type:complete
MENITKLKKITYTKGEKIDTNVSDSRRKSLMETIMDVGLGLIISTIINFTILPLYVEGIAEREILTMAQISLWYTLIALVRRYMFRRLFEGFRKTS